MGQHVRGKLGPAGRVLLVRLMVEGGCSERVAAAALAVAPATAHHWKHRFLAASIEEHAAGSWRLTARVVRTARQIALRWMSRCVFGRSADALVGDRD